MANCCRCSPAPYEPSCRTVITSADLAELVYVQGLDENLCVKFQELADILQLTDCEGNRITFDEPIVTCEGFQDVLCEVFSTLGGGNPLQLEVTEIVGANCQTYTVPETLLTVIDSPAINLTANGPFNHTLRADLVLSTDAGQSAEIRSNGLYVPSLCEASGDLPVGAPVVFGTTPLVGADCQTHVVNETPITVVDTTTINLTSTGLFGHTISGDVIVSPDSGQQIQVRGNGLYVPTAPVFNLCNALTGLPNGGLATPGVTRVVGTDCSSYLLPANPPDAPIIGIDTNTIDITISGSDQHTISAVTRLSTSPGNILTTDGTGLYAPDTTLTAIDTNCIDMVINEPANNQYQVSANIKLNPDSGNAISCTPTGLYVSPAVNNVNVVAVDTQSVNMTVTESPSDNFLVSALVNIANSYPGFPAGCNGLVSTASGLAAPPNGTAAAGTATSTPTGFLIQNEPIDEDEVVVSDWCQVNVTNPSDCRSAFLLLQIYMPGVTTNFVTNPTFNVTGISIEHEVNFPGLQVTPPSLYTSWVVNNNSLSTVGTGGNPPAERSFVYIIPPNFTGFYRIRGYVTQRGGDIGSIVVGRIGLNYILATI